MYAKAVQGMPAEDAVKWAEGELKKIYALRLLADPLSAQAGRGDACAGSTMAVHGNR